MASLLPSDIANIVANAFQGVLMSGTLRRETAAVVDGFGDGNPITTVETFAVQGIRDNFSSYFAAMNGIPLTDVKILLIMNLIVPRTIPRQDDLINIRDEWYKVRKVIAIDPASASIDLQCFRVDEPPFDLLPYSPFAWYDPSDPNTRFQDAAGLIPALNLDDPVLRLNDKAGSAQHMILSGGIPRYKRSGDIHWIETDGVDDYLRVAYSAPLVQPWDRISAFRLLSHTNGDRFFGGQGANDNGVMATDILGTWSISAGGVGVFFPAVAVGTDFVVTERYAGSGSRVATDNNAYSTGDAGSGSSAGMTLAAAFNNSSFGHLRFYGTAVLPVLADSDIATLRTHFASQYGGVL